MDRRERAELILSAAQARHPGACLPDRATSPADLLGTLTLEHEFIARCDEQARRDAQLRELAEPVTSSPDSKAG
jgi:hypothetical protein